MNTHRPTHHYFLGILLMIISSMLMTACGGGGGGGSGTITPIADVTGDWTITESGTSNCPGEETYYNVYTITVSQSDNTLTVSTPVGIFTGSINGDSISWTGSFAEDGGVTTITSMSLTVSSDGNSLSGTSSWSWTDGDSSCSGTNQTVNATRVPGTGPIPNAPSSLSATSVSQSSINLSWIDNADNETGFKVERSTSAASGFSQITLIANANQTSYTDTGLNASTTYYYRVRAYNNNGDSGYSNTANTTTDQTVVNTPTAPSALSASATSSSSISLSWTDNSNNETAFLIERSNSSTTGFSQIAAPSANTTSYVDSGLNSATTYYYRVRAFNSGLYSSYTNTVNATTQSIATAPIAPSNLTASATSSSSISLNWTDNSSNETAFKIERSTSASTGFSQIATTLANTNSYVSTGLNAATTYYYRVRATNSGLDSSYSNTANATTHAITVIPAAASNLTVTANSPSQIRLTWNDNSSNESGFRIERQHPTLYNTWQLVTNTSANTTSYTHNYVTDQTHLEYRIISYNSAGDGPASNIAWAPPKLRIINDLYNYVSTAGNDWGNLNTMIRVRIGPNESAVLNDSTNTYEKLTPYDTVYDISNGLDITPSYNSTSSYRDFNVSVNSPAYTVYIQMGWWEYFWPGYGSGYWVKHLSQVLSNTGTCCVYKWSGANVTSHTAGYHVLTASQVPLSFPQGSYNNTY